MTLLATSHYFFSLGFVTYLIVGIICVLIGLIVGWLAWRHCRAQADRIEHMNEDLRKIYKDLKAKSNN